MMPEDDRPRAMPLLPSVADRARPAGDESAAEVVAWLDRAELPEGKLRYVLHPPGHLVVVRLGEEVFAFDQVCVHAGASLLLGEVRDGTLRCRAHDYHFDLHTGELVHPAGERMCQPTWRVERRGERWVVLGKRAADVGAGGQVAAGGGVGGQVAVAAGGVADKRRA